MVDRAVGSDDLSLDVRGVLLCQRALILRRSGRTIEAMQTFGDAIASLRDAPADLGKAHLNRGTVHLDRRELAEAERDFAAAAHAYADAGDQVARAKARHNQGYTFYLAGDLVGALAVMEEAHAVLGPISPVVRAIGEQDRAEVLLAAGLTSQGRELLSGAARDYGARRMRQLQAEAELVLATSLLPVDPASARDEGRRARRRFAALKADAWVARADAVVLAAEIELDGDHGSLMVRAR